MPAMEKELRAKLYFLDWAPMLFTSALTVLTYCSLPSLGSGPAKAMSCCVALTSAVQWGSYPGKILLMVSVVDFAGS